MPDWISGIIAVIGALSANEARKEKKRANRKREADIAEQTRVTELDSNRTKKLRQFQVNRYGYGGNNDDTGSRT